MGVLFGSAMPFVSVVGHLNVQGAVRVGGFRALAGGLMALGIAKDSLLRYETALKANKFMLVVHGDAPEIQRAQELLKASGLDCFDHHLVRRRAGSTPAGAAGLCHHRIQRSQAMNMKIPEHRRAPAEPGCERGRRHGAGPTLKGKSACKP
jgi:hypothetical protein